MLEPHADEAEKRAQNADRRGLSGFLKRLWRGELNLPFVFWVLWIGVDAVFYLPILILDARDPKNWINLSEQEKVIFIWCSYIGATWWVAFSFLVEKTAKRYQGPKVWKYSAQICAMLTLANAMYQASKFILYHYFGIDL